RRRHTRSKRDWSSDVCSSDLIKEVDQLVGDPAQEERQRRRESVDLFSLFAGALAVQESLQLDTLRDDRGNQGDKKEPRGRKKEEIGRASCRERGKRAEG